MNANNFDDRGQKAVDVSSTYIQVLIGLASGIITATLGLSTLVGLDGFNSILLKISLFSLGLSIVSGLIGLGGLVAAIGEANNTNPPADSRVKNPTFAQFILFGAGVFLMIWVIPIKP